MAVAHGGRRIPAIFSMPFSRRFRDEEEGRAGVHLGPYPAARACSPGSPQYYAGAVDWAAWLVSWGSFIVGAVSLALGVGGVLYGQWARTHPVKSRVLLEVQAVRLEIPSSDRLQVTWDGEPVVDPYLLTARVTNLGPADLSRGSFDGGWIRLTLDASQRPVPLGMPAGEDVEVGEFRVTDETVSFHPGLVGVGVTATSSYLVSRRPAYTVRASVPGFVVTRSVSAPPVRVTLKAMWLGLLVTAGALTYGSYLGAYLRGDLDDSGAAQMVTLSVGLLVVIAVTVVLPAYIKNGRKASTRPRERGGRGKESAR